MPKRNPYSRNPWTFFGHMSIHCPGHYLVVVYSHYIDGWAVDSPSNSSWLVPGTFDENCDL